MTKRMRVPLSIALRHMFIVLTLLAIALVFVGYHVRSKPVSHWCVIYPGEGAEAEAAPLYVNILTYYKESKAYTGRGSFSIKSVQWEKPTEKVLDRNQSAQLLDTYIGNKDGKLSRFEALVLLLLAGDQKSLK